MSYQYSQVLQAIVDKLICENEKTGCHVAGFTDMNFHQSSCNPFLHTAELEFFVQFAGTKVLSHHTRFPCPAVLCLRTVSSCTPDGVASASEC